LRDRAVCVKTADAAADMEVEGLVARPWMLTVKVGSARTGGTVVTMDVVYVGAPATWYSLTGGNEVATGPEEMQNVPCLRVFRYISPEREVVVSIKVVGCFDGGLNVMMEAGKGTKGAGKATADGRQADITAAGAGDVANKVGDVAVEVAVERPVARPGMTEVRVAKAVIESLDGPGVGTPAFQV
jgi:hypothetical protein